MKTSPGLRRGATSPLRPGLVFWGRLRGEERWVTVTRFAEMKRTKNAWTNQTRKTPEGRSKRRAEQKRRSKLPHVMAYQARHQREKRHIYSPRQRVTRRRYKKMRMATDPGYRMVANLSGRMRNAIRFFGGKKDSPTQSLIGCTHEFFRGWLEAQFTGKMSWKNYGKLWSVDHIKPVVSFDLLDVAGQRAAFHYSNCRPLLKRNNCSKSDRIEFEGKTVRAGHLRAKNIIPFRKVA